MLRIAADLGNTRMKWSRLDDEGRPTPSVALPPDDPIAWSAVLDDWRLFPDTPSRWAVSSVNPPVARQLAAFLAGRGAHAVRWFQTAAEVPVAKDVEGAETGGADRALAVLAALRLMPAGRPGVVVSCGTAITLERISGDGVWQGGVIAPGLFLSARALHSFTAQLPLVHPDRSAPHWGRGTVDSLEAGVFWGAVGALRELLARQRFPGGETPWVVWTGGDADRLAREVSGDDARIRPDLVLAGLAGAGF